MDDAYTRVWTLLFVCFWGEVLLPGMKLGDGAADGEDMYIYIYMWR